MKKVKERFEKVYVFVGGVTKFLKDCSQAEINILIENGKGHYFEDAVETKQKVAKEAVEAEKK